MKAVAITAHGGIEKVRYMDVERPILGPGEVLIEARAVALNHLDIWVRNGLPGSRLSMPHVLGADGAGVVAGVGAEVSRVKAGDRVVINPGLHCGVCEFCQAGEQSLCATFGIMGETCPGTCAEYFKVPQANVHTAGAPADDLQPLCLRLIILLDYCRRAIFVLFSHAAQFAIGTAAQEGRRPCTGKACPAGPLALRFRTHKAKIPKQMLVGVTPFMTRRDSYPRRRALTAYR
jgi:hypothetical protein